VPVSFATPPRTRLLSTVARAAARLGVAGEDAKIAALLAAASDEAAEVLGYGCVRAEVLETLEASGTGDDRVLSWGPVLELVSISHLGGARDLSDFALVSPTAGLLRSFGGWGGDGQQSRRLDWSARYWAGWLTPADDVSSNAVTYSSAGTVTLGDAEWPLLRPGDVVMGGVSTLTVVERVSSARIAVAESLSDLEVTAGTVFLCSTLPLDVEQAVIERVGDLRSGTTASAGGAVTSIEADGVRKTFSTSSTGTTRVSAYDQSLRRRARIPL